MATSEKQHAEVTERELMVADHWLSRIEEPGLRANGETRRALAQLIADFAAEVERKARQNEANWWMEFDGVELASLDEDAAAGEEGALEVKRHLAELGGTNG